MFVREQQPAQHRPFFKSGRLAAVLDKDIGLLLGNSSYLPWKRVTLGNYGGV